MRHASLLLVLPLLLLHSPAPACDLCGAASRRVSLVQEYQNAQAVIFGRIANPQLEPGFSGKGSTEFHIERIVKDHPDLPRQNMILLSRYLPILDAKDPPRYVMFLPEPKKMLEPSSGRQISSAGVLDFLVEFERYRNDPDQALMFATGYLDHADPAVAEEAFLIFARAEDQRIARLAKHFAPEKFRKLVQTRGLDPERLSMFAYLLGACGTASDADLLRSLIKNPAERNYKSFEGILAGFITMRPQEGWACATDILKNSKSSLLMRYATLRTFRFFYNSKMEQYVPHVLTGMGLAVQQDDLADIAIGDLRKWKRWDHTRLIVSCYDKKTYQSPIVKNSIVRYALACPLPEARALVERVRRQDPELVRYLQEDLNEDSK
jgi:hypothetical protein